MINILRKVYCSIFSYEIRLWIYTLRNPRQYKKFRSVYEKKQCIFVHITKTAGTSVAKCLLDYHPNHITAIDYKIIFGNSAFNKYYKFAFVRNPWDRLYSAYRYLKSGGWHEEDKKWYEDNIKNYEDFNDFVLKWLTSENINQYIHFKPQNEFICDRNGDLLLDYLGYFETVNDDFDHIASKLGSEAKLEHHNSNPHKDYRQIYNETSRDIVAKIYKRDIELFGYEFDGIKRRLVITEESSQNK